MLYNYTDLPAENIPQKKDTEVFTEKYCGRFKNDRPILENYSDMLYKIVDFIGVYDIERLFNAPKVGASISCCNDLNKFLKGENIPEISKFQLYKAFTENILIDVDILKRFHVCHKGCSHEDYSSYCPFSEDLEDNFVELSNMDLYNLDDDYNKLSFKESVLEQGNGNYLNIGDGETIWGEAKFVLDTSTSFRSYIINAANMIRNPSNDLKRTRGTIIDVKTNSWIFHEIYMNKEKELCFFLRELGAITGVDEATQADYAGKMGMGYPELCGAKLGSRNARMKAISSLVDAIISAKIPNLSLSTNFIKDFREKGIYNMVNTRRKIMNELKKELWNEEVAHLQEYSS